MILYELNKLYDQFAEDPEYNDVLPGFGSSLQKMSFIAVLKPDGTLFDIHDAKVSRTIPARGKQGKEREVFVPREVLVLGGAHPPGAAATPRLLWDTTAYIFGYYASGANKKDKDKKKAREVLFPAYRDYHRKWMKKNAIQDAGMQAVCAFLDAWDPNNIPDDIQEKLDAFGGNFGVFQIQGEQNYVFQSPEIKTAWEREPEGENLQRGMCLITGEEDVPIVATIESKVKLSGTSVGGGAISSFNAPAYESYGKTQTYNSPISEVGGFKAYNALNVLIADPRYHIRLADTTVVFWTGKRSTFIDLLAPILGGRSLQDETIAGNSALLQRLETFWKAVGHAAHPDLAALGEDVETPFYMLGIAPNAARIVVRFWHVSTVGDFILRLREHHQALALEKKFDSEPDHIPLWMILAQTARDTKEIPPLLGGALLRSVINGSAYPMPLYQLTLNRISVGHEKYKVGSKVSYPQASVIKAFLTRKTKTGGIGMSLNLENKAPAYLLGRLFATLEKTQDESSGGVNAGVGDKFYSSASATPRVVFPMLLDMFRKYLKKLGATKPGRAVNMEKIVGKILDDIDSTQGFPSNLTMEDRGLFALGYYQQMQVFFTKKADVVAED